MATLVKEKREYISSILIFKYDIYKHCSDILRLFRKLFYTFMMSFKYTNLTVKIWLFLKLMYLFVLTVAPAGMIASCSS